MMLHMQIEERDGGIIDATEGREQELDEEEDEDSFSEEQDYEENK